MKISDQFGSDFLSSDDFTKAGSDLTIAAVVMEEVGNDGQKPIIYFDQFEEKGLPLNKTNAEKLTELFGTDETDDWIGHDINVYQSRTQFQGKNTPCTRMRQARGNGSTSRQSA